MTPTMRRMPKRGAVVIAACLMEVGIVLAPKPAFAASAFDILIPKPAEFFPALIAFLVIWIVLQKFIWPSVLKTLDSRQQTIQNNIDEAEKAKLEAQKALRRAEASVNDAEIKADAIIAEARKAAEKNSQEIVAEAHEEAKDITERTRESLLAERDATLEALTEQVADLSVDLATKIIGESLDADAQRRVIERYLAKAGDIDEP